MGKNDGDTSSYVRTRSMDRKQGLGEDYNYGGCSLTPHGLLSTNETETSESFMHKAAESGKYMMWLPKNW